MRIACMQLFQTTDQIKDLELIARITYEHGYYHQACQYWKKASAITPSQKYLSLYADSLFLSGRYEDSLNVYRKISHKTFQDHHNLAYIYFYLQEDSKIQQSLLFAKRTKTIYFQQGNCFLEAMMDWMKIKDLLAYHWLKGTKRQRHRKKIEKNT